MRLCETPATLIGAGTIISPIIKIVTTVAILGAIYLFFVKPALDTTENISDTVSGSISQSQDQANEAAAEAQAQASAAEISSTRQQATSYANSLLAGSQPWTEASKAVLTCTKKAGDDINKLERCVDLGQSITSGVLSDRNFAVSYADSLEAQGKTGDAAQVRSCVEKAGYEAKPMDQCRKLADQLLFG